MLLTISGPSVDGMFLCKITRDPSAKLGESLIQALKIYLNRKYHFVIMFKMLEFP